VRVRISDKTSFFRQTEPFTDPKNYMYVERRKDEAKTQCPSTNKTEQQFISLFKQMMQIFLQENCFELFKAEP